VPALERNDASASPICTLPIKRGSKGGTWARCRKRELLKIMYVENKEKKMLVNDGIANLVFIVPGIASGDPL
jgi:hypothetical protein